MVVSALYCHNNFGKNWKNLARAESRPVTDPCTRAESRARRTARPGVVRGLRPGPPDRSSNALPEPLEQFRGGSDIAERGRADPSLCRRLHFIPLGIHGSSFAASDLAPELTGMPQKSKKGPRFLFTILE